MGMSLFELPYSGICYFGMEFLVWEKRIDFQRDLANEMIVLDRMFDCPPVIIADMI